MHLLTGVNLQKKPIYMEDIDTYEVEGEAVQQFDLSGKTLSVCCPKCDQLFYMIYNNYMDDYGVFRKVWGFCTCCNYKYEALVVNYE